MQKLLRTRHHALVDLREYIVSEKFIWDDLIAKGEQAVKKVREQWRRTKTVHRTLLAWPSRFLEGADGSTITDIVTFAVPDGVVTFTAAVELARATEAYALLLVERQDRAVKVILESSHGARGWTLPIRRHGDVDVLEKEEASTDTECIGVLWRPQQVRG